MTKFNKYLANKIRPDIVFVVRKLSKYKVDPCKIYFQVTKKVIHYLKRIM